MEFQGFDNWKSRHLRSFLLVFFVWSLCSLPQRLGKRCHSLELISIARQTRTRKWKKSKAAIDISFMSPVHQILVAHDRINYGCQAVIKGNYCTFSFLARRWPLPPSIPLHRVLHRTRLAWLLIKQFPFCVFFSTLSTIRRRITVIEKKHKITFDTVAFNIGLKTFVSKFNQQWIKIVAFTRYFKRKQYIYI